MTRDPHPKAPGLDAGVTEEMIRDLVHTFYARVRRDPLIGPIFNRVVEDWPAHLDKLCAFWSSVTLMTGRYKGTPMKVHAELPAALDVVDELAVAAAEVEHGGVGADILLEERRGQHLPHRRAVTHHRAEAKLVDALQFGRVFDALAHRQGGERIRETSHKASPRRQPGRPVSRQPVQGHQRIGHTAGAVEDR